MRSSHWELPQNFEAHKWTQTKRQFTEQNGTELVDFFLEFPADQSQYASRWLNAVQTPEIDPYSDERHSQLKTKLAFSSRNVAWRPRRTARGARWRARRSSSRTCLKANQTIKFIVETSLKVVVFKCLPQKYLSFSLSSAKSWFWNICESPEGVNRLTSDF